jgi:murein DD-endopeptidase MepM/ murein hydrolase activator NlpD
MRPLPLLAACSSFVVLLALSACSGEDAMTDAAPSGPSAGAAAEAPGEAPPPGPVGAEDAGPDGPDAAAGDAAIPPKGNDCVVGGRYCGGDKVSGDPKTLYLCKGPGTPKVVETCATSCQVNPGTDDSCALAPGAHVPSPVPGKVVTYPYGVKNSGYAAGYHTGDDYATPVGSNAVAVRSGTIQWSNDNGGAYGKWMGLDADNGRTYVYCHLSTRLLAKGTKVTAGQVIAKTGATGNVTGPHLHFEDHPKGPFVYAQDRKPAW